MDLASFWEFVDSVRSISEDDDGFIAHLRDALLERDLETLLGFQENLWHVVDDAYRADLWDAAALINGGCSDDAFEYFRAWLVAQGSSVYRSALDDPDSIARIGRPEGELEELLYLAPTLYEARTGAVMPGLLRAGRVQLKGRREGPETLAGRFPRLWEKFGTAR
ncbi:MAG: DUF4240 domain-containing protein [Sandaracinaceae bacterium]|nr:DUF4240 domain-containing protein [Sandaracinaceae bacterium]